MKMNTILQLALIALSLSASECHQFKIYNHCPFTIWPGILGNAGLGQPLNGGFELGQYQTRVIDVGHGWGGRVWGRTQCDASGRCVTGDCGGKIQCNGAGGVPPVTLAEWTFDGHANQDYYDISLVDGYNLPMQIRLVQGTHQDSHGKYECNTAGCNADLNARCPDELKVKNRDGYTVACMSACMKFNTDEYCCRGAHNTPQTCKARDWPKNYPAIFKQACPDAYSYAYDDTTSTYTCRSAPGRETAYEIVFCP
jgi:hypothetical protein